MFGTTDRRHFMKHAAAGAAVTVPGMSFLTGLRAQAAELKKKNKSLIILWMGGGPTTIDLWDMKPEQPERRRAQAQGRPRPAASRSPSTCRRWPSSSSTCRSSAR